MHDLLTDTPYAPPRSFAALQPVRPASPSLGRIQAVVWCSFLGTVIAGGLFGMLFGFILGLIVGFILAGIIGVLPFGVLSLIALARPNQGLLLALCSGTGALTGFLCLAPWLAGGQDLLLPLLLVVVFGGLGGFAGAALPATLLGKPKTLG